MSTTKARSLDVIRHKLSLFQIPSFLYFSQEEWKNSREEMLGAISEKFQGALLAVRSSAGDEDGIETSRAGEYDSVLNVPSDNTEAVQTAIDKVFASYHKNGTRDGNDEVLVQLMLEDTSMSGVVFTYDLNTGAPYYVINYDDVSGKTNTVTSGEGMYSNRTLYIHRSAVDALRSERFQSLITAVGELEKIMESQFLDIEFAMGQDLVPYLLQVRTITTRPNWNRAVVLRIDKALEGIQSFVKSRFQPVDGVYGRTTVLGQMPDWNPAEMIGRAPRRLAFSLYKTLITDQAWRIARDKMGYSVPEGQPLMVSLAGQPFIDTRLSFHSYLPKSLPRNIGEKLVDVWVDRLRENPQFHDKVEFDVAITAWSFDIDERIEAQTDGVLKPAERTEFIERLHRHTVQLVQGTTQGSIGSALADIKELESRQINSGAGNGEALDTLFRLTDECIHFGTVPFSILARHGFIARTLLVSLIRCGILTRDDVLQIQSGIRTVASTLVEDMSRLQRGDLKRDDFMQSYGHLRPGTYDILSLRYDQIENFGTEKTSSRSGPAQSGFILPAEKRKKIDEQLKSDGFSEMDADGLFTYIQEATAGREYAKFVFTRSVSDILETIASVGLRNGLSREEISHIPLSDLMELATFSGEGSVEDRLRVKAEEGAETHAITSAIRLPQVLHDVEGVHVVPFQVSQPNFITDKRIDGECIALRPGDPPQSIAGKIVLIESADPGFDWIFAYPISGLVTKYGGANSHMAIRCAEFSIPAAIGCGEQKFERLVGSHKVSLDCASGLVQPQF